MRIQHNIPALSAYRNYSNNTSALAKNLEKLSSGYKINRAGDDAAGLAISEKMRAQITGLEVAQKNAKDGISLVQTAEGALTEVHDMLNRMYELAEQSANGTYQDEVDREQLQKEIESLSTEINRIADSANFNGIKLFDGSLSGANLSVDGLTTSTIDMAKGVEVTQGTNGGGSFGEYSINITSAFGAGDTLTINLAGKASTASNGGKIELVYGTNFEGDTIEKQAEAIAKALNADSDIVANFKVDVEGTTIKLTSTVEGNDLNAQVKDEDGNLVANPNQTSTITSVDVEDKKAVAETAAKKWGESTPAADNGTMGISKLVALFDVADSSTGIDLKEGDTMTFEVTLADSTTLNVTATAGEDFAIGPLNSDTINNLVNFLNNKAKFEDNEDTVVDESLIKFSDMFTVAGDAASGGISFTDKISYVKSGGTSIKVTTSTGQSLTSAQSTAAVTTAAKPYDYVMELTSTDADNLSIGDKFTIKGELADGRKFEFDVEAGKDFKVGDDYDGTMANLKKFLEGDTEIQLKKNNKAAGVAKLGDIFGDDKEIKLDDANHQFVSNKNGKVLVSHIDEVKLTNGSDTAVTPSLINGLQKSSADSIISFSEGVEYGTIVEVGGKKYEIVKNADEVTSAKNVAVEVDDLSDTDAVAKAMAEALKGELDEDTYSVASSGSKVTISTVEVGNSAKAIEVNSSGDKVKQIEFTFDPKKIQSGSTVSINGQTYEFVEKGGKLSDASHTKIEVDNFEKATAVTLGNALAEAANGNSNAAVLSDENGKVTVRGMANDEGKVIDPTVKFNNGTAGLTLQIGDTAEDFNKMKVSIYNMHTADMGIGTIDVSTQDGAADAMAKIKDAINYVSDVRGTLGATQNRLDHTINNLSVMQENIQDAESTIRDVDVAKEMMEYTKNNILVQSAQAMLAQANQLPQGVLQLLQ